MKRKILLLTLVLSVVFSFSLVAFAEEHGWNSDYTKYNTEEIAENPAVYATGIVTLEDGIYYFNDEGTVQTGKKKTVDGKLYYFGKKDGKPVAGVLYTGTYNSKMYKDGVLLTGVYDGKRYKGGVLLTGLYNSKRYKDGVLFTGVYDGKRYKDGVLLTGVYDGKRYSKGVLLTGLYDGKRYSKGVLLTGFYDDKYYRNGLKYTGFKGHYYYKKGVKYKPDNSGLHKLKGDYYYVKTSGYIYIPEESGAYKMSNGKFYYIYRSGHVKKVSEKGKYTINGRKYYMYKNSSIIMTGESHFKKIDGATYRIGKKGYLLKGWIKVDGNKYYMSKKTYKRYQDGIKTINDYKYYFSKSGKVQKSKWYYKDGLKRYYFGKTGKAVKDCAKYIGKYKYYFNKKGVCQTNLVKYKGYDWVASHSLKVDVDVAHQVVTIYAKDGSRGYTIPVAAFICTTGSWDRPTDPGDYRTGAIFRWKELGGKTETEDNGEKCYGQYVTHIYGHVFFHSIVCSQNGNNHTLYTGAYNWLGNRGSHGCVRLRTGDAYIMYNLAARQNMWVHIGSHNKVGAFGKPVLKPISTCYDPTDPNV